jgi:hypothetical protein
MPLTCTILGVDLGCVVSRSSALRFSRIISLDFHNCRIAKSPKTPWSGEPCAAPIFATNSAGYLASLVIRCAALVDRPQVRCFGLTVITVFSYATICFEVGELGVFINEGASRERERASPTNSKD